MRQRASFNILELYNTLLFLLLVVLKLIGKLSRPFSVTLSFSTQALFWFLYTVNTALFKQITVINTVMQMYSYIPFNSLKLYVFFY